VAVVTAAQTMVLLELLIQAVAVAVADIGIMQVPRVAPVL
jgi:hypothetical protein